MVCITDMVTGIMSITITTHIKSKTIGYIISEVTITIRGAITMRSFIDDAKVTPTI